MARKKTALKPKTVTLETLMFPQRSSLRSSLLFDFFEYHKEPKRPPIVNIIRKTMLERAWAKNDYDEMENKYGIDEKRIRDTISSKFEPMVIKSLCAYLGISPKTTIKDVFANYDFEQKAICKLVGHKNEEKRAEFLAEFEKSWSDETYLAYREEIKDYPQLVCVDEEIESRIADEKMKEIFYKLRRIYDEYPEWVEAFCNSFIESD